MTRRLRLLLLFWLALVPSADAAMPPIEFTTERLDNGLRVIYAPLHQAPVVHVRVLYHVGSKDERPDRQGFAHMFEHMMFRGSAHVAPQEHMQLVTNVGGYSNAYTAFDETVYLQTLPANQLELALYLEADRMASFKVSDEIYQVERNVVAEEWRISENQPYGSFYQKFFDLVFDTSHYDWTPIGDMDDLAAASAEELQHFFNTYYVPNNAVLVISGDFDPAEASRMVHRFYDWIPSGGNVPRRSPPEPVQTEPRREVVTEAVPLARIDIGYVAPPYRSADRVALNALSLILGGMASSRLDEQLVNTENPLCMQVYTSYYPLEQHGLFYLGGVVLQGVDPAAVEAALLAEVDRLRERGVTAEELAKAKTVLRKQLVSARETAEDLAGQLGDAALFAGDAQAANREAEQVEALTVTDLQRVARETLVRGRSNTLLYLPGEATAASPADAEKERGPAETDSETRVTRFPADYPTEPPWSKELLRSEFEKGTETRIDGATVVVMPDHRLPLVSWWIVTRGGSYADPKGQEGLASLTAQMLRRGAAGIGYAELNERLESRGIDLSSSAGTENMWISGSSLRDELPQAMLRTRQILKQPDFPADEFARLKAQTLSGLQYELASPEDVAARVLAEALFGDSPAGRKPTPDSIAAIQLDDLKEAYRRLYSSRDAILLIAGDIDVPTGQSFARELLRDWRDVEPPEVGVPAPTAPPARRVILVDRPEGAQSMIRMEVPAYTLQNEDKFAGTLAGEILSAGIDSRLGRYVRAEKGYAYSVWGYFNPELQFGTFYAGTETDFKNTADAVEAMFKVYDDMASQPADPEELAAAKLLMSGSLVMDQQTIQQQARQRIRGLLNGYPIDYYDTYPEKIADITPEQIRAVMDQYVDDEAMTVVVIAPAAAVKEQLQRLGEVEVRPMPSAAQETAAE